METLTAQPNPRRPDDTRQRRLLIVDDDSAVRSVVKHVAHAGGFAVTIAGNGREAMEHIERGTFDVIVTDLYMPEKDGLELIRHLRHVHPAPVIIAMSGGGKYGVSSLRVAGLLGAAHVLPKPFEVARLIELLRGV